MGDKRKILIIMGRYLPGYKDGGPVRTIKNLTDYLGDEYEFRILTCDRDHGDIKPYPNIMVNDWNQVGKAKVYYVRPKGFSFKLIKKLSKQADLLYVCGCFNDYAIKTLILNRFSQISKPIVIAAMGLFSPLEFRIKYAKKKLFTGVFNLLGMFKNVYWSATSEIEIEEIFMQVKTEKNKFFVAEDLPRMVDKTPVKKVKVSGLLEVVWISRIATKKNLYGAVEILKNVKSNVNFTIYGPIHEKEYWLKCKKELEKLPSNIKWQYKGDIDSEQVVETLKKYHVFLFPTLGENYGHVIQEALSAGCACVISDQTPWKDLEKYGAGYVFPLTDNKPYAEMIYKYASMNNEEFQKNANKVYSYAEKVSNNKVFNTGYKEIFKIDYTR